MPLRYTMKQKIEKNIYLGNYGTNVCCIDYDNFFVLSN